MVDDTSENLLICMEYCGTCPSLPFPSEPLLFCALGCSLEAVSKKSCNVLNATSSKSTGCKTCTSVKPEKPQKRKNINRKPELNRIRIHGHFS